MTYYLRSLLIYFGAPWVASSLRKNSDIDAIEMHALKRSTASREWFTLIAPELHLKSRGCIDYHQRNRSEDHVRSKGPRETWIFPCHSSLSSAGIVAAQKTLHPQIMAKMIWISITPSIRIFGTKHEWINTHQVHLDQNHFDRCDNFKVIDVRTIREKLLKKNLRDWATTELYEGILTYWHSLAHKSQLSSRMRLSNWELSPNGSSPHPHWPSPK